MQRGPASDATFIGFEVASPAGVEVEVGHDPG
jgi:hypothetical protein